MAQAGLEFDNLQTPITDTAFRERLADFWLSGATIESSDQVRAREIMGDHFYGIGDLIKYFKDGFDMYNSPLSENFQDWLAQIPLSEQQLVEHSKTHILFPGYKEFNLRWLFLNKLKGYLDQNEWRQKEPYVNDIFLKNRWYLLRLRPLPGSENKTLEEQLALLPEIEEVPPACVVTLGM